MNFLSQFAIQKLSPKWHYSADHTLWRLMFSENGLTIGEDRDTENKTVSFFCLNSADGSVLWSHKTFAEQWWIGMEGVSGDRLFFHGFKKPDMPEHKSIICVDVHTGNERWRNDDCAFLAADAQFVYGYRDLFDRRVYYKLEGNSGTFLEEQSELPVPPNGLYTSEKSDFSFPRPYGEVTIPEISSFTGKYSDTIKSIEYIETDKFVIFNIHTVRNSSQKEMQESLTNTLYVIDRHSGKKIFKDVLNSDSPYPVPDSFFLDMSVLYYIKERTSLIALDLTQ